MHNHRIKDLFQFNLLLNIGIYDINIILYEGFFPCINCYHHNTTGFFPDVFLF